MQISDLIKQLEHIKENEGDLNVFQWKDGMPVLVKQVVARITIDPKEKGCYIDI